MPMVVGAVLEGMGLLTIVLPPWLLAVGYTLLGWSVGLGFTRDILGTPIARCRRSPCRSSS